jgi:hypothetical protein
MPSVPQPVPEVPLGVLLTKPLWQLASAVALFRLPPTVNYRPTPQTSNAKRREKLSSVLGKRALKTFLIFNSVSDHPPTLEAISIQLRRSMACQKPILVSQENG